MPSSTPIPQKVPVEYVRDKLPLFKDRCVILLILFPT